MAKQGGKRDATSKIGSRVTEEERENQDYLSTGKTDKIVKACAESPENRKCRGMVGLSKGTKYRSQIITDDEDSEDADNDSDISLSEVEESFQNSTEHEDSAGVINDSDRSSIEVKHNYQNSLVHNDSTEDVNNSDKSWTDVKQSFRKTPDHDDSGEVINDSDRSSSEFDHSFPTNSNHGDDVIDDSVYIISDSSQSMLQPGRSSLAQGGCIGPSDDEDDIECLIQGDDDISVNSIKIEDKSSSSVLANGRDSTVTSPSINNSSQSEHKLMNRSVLEQQLNDKLTTLNSLLKAQKSCPPNSLKDNGKQLSDKIESSRKEIKKLREELNSIAANTSTESVKEKLKLEALLTTSDQKIEDYGKKAMQTHNIQQALTLDALVTLHSCISSCPSATDYMEDPRGLKVELMAHQKNALSWLLWREQQKPSGGILADDMGLGKTLTMIALILKAREMTSDEEADEWNSREDRVYPGQNLVVCPATLVGQWESQVTQHCRHGILDVLVHHGANRTTHSKKLAQYDLVITTYGIVNQENKTADRRNRKGALFRVKWKRTILDEAHIIRNHKAQTSLAACDLLSAHRWCLTGTPVHNKTLDMYGLLKFLQCSPFDDLTVWKRWVENKSAAGMQRLNTVVKSILLRRTKEELKGIGALACLPQKQTESIYIHLDENEQKVYSVVLHFSKTLLAQYLMQKDTNFGHYHERVLQVQQRLKSATEIKTHEILVLLLRLRQICCLPGLIQAMLDNEDYELDGIEPENVMVENLETQMRRMSITPSGGGKVKDGNMLSSTNPVFDITRQSSKIKCLLKTLNKILTTDDKVVIVSQWSTLLRHISPHLTKLNIKFAQLDGSVPVKDRQSVIESFTSGNRRVMLLSLTAGGVGLNLAAGNRLIIFDPHWNPQLEAQACDRVYRVGQNKPVHVYRLICKDTIEERIEQLQKKKLQLAGDVLSGQVNKHNAKLSLQDLKKIFELC